MPSKTFITREKSMPSFKANATGDFTLKAMLIFHSENPRALKN